MPRVKDPHFYDVNQFSSSQIDAVLRNAATLFIDHLGSHGRDVVLSPVSSGRAQSRRIKRAPKVKVTLR